ncbi:MAG TPA: hypothetical protein VIY08_06010 [Candidatus Nitrosocosmicus sp.]
MIKMNIYTALSTIYEEPNKKTRDGPWINTGEWCNVCEARSENHHVHKYCSECNMLSESLIDECICHHIPVTEYIIRANLDSHNFFIKNNIKKDMSYIPLYGKRNGDYCCGCRRRKYKCKCVFVCGLTRICDINGKTGCPIYKKCKYWSDLLKKICHECIGQIDLKSM